ncbi:MAG: hypothetical protein HY666_06865 [Chloroflexi bacterium]|nr:hypothetical protein [Chloroflexota bacterium]
MLEKDAASSVDLSTLTLGAKLLSNARASSLLLQHGYIDSSILLIREMIHTLMLTLFLHAHPEKAETWMKANTPSQREKFAFREIWRTVEHGEAWNGLYKLFSKMAHANVEARVTFGRSRKAFGYDLQVRGVYDPRQIIVLFVLTLQIPLWFQGYFCDWYQQELSIPAEFESEMKTMNFATEEFNKQLWRRAEKDTPSEVHKDELSISEQVQAKALLMLMALEKRIGEK